MDKKKVDLKRFIWSPDDIVFDNKVSKDEPEDGGNEESEPRDAKKQDSTEDA